MSLEAPNTPEAELQSLLTEGEKMLGNLPESPAKRKIEIALDALR